MNRHGLCVQETSQGKCFQDGKKCGWRIINCFFDWLWKPIEVAILLIGMAFLVYLLLSLFGKPKQMNGEIKKAVLVTVTAYTPTEEECDDTPLVTAFNKRVKAGTIAVSRDLEKQHGWKEGDTINLQGIGVFEVADRMHQRWERKVDILFFDKSEAIEFGKRRVSAIKM